MTRKIIEKMDKKYREKNYNGITWEEAYNDEQQRERMKKYSWEFREVEKKLRENKRKRICLERKSLEKTV